ncbi:MAG: EAL domain-containing protein [Acidiferrobacterales bacterium]|nr:EAL domain-containing protein [Acidiferrobacterales bacterium]
MRWQHSSRNLLLSGQFIPLAEESGLIKPIGVWVLNKACSQGKKWLSSGFNFGRIAINISGVQINRGKFFETVSNALALSGLPPDHLELEITENAIRKQTEKDLL